MSQRFILLGKAENGITRLLGSYKSRADAGTAMGLYGMEEEEYNVIYTIKEIESKKESELK